MIRPPAPSTAPTTTAPPTLASRIDAALPQTQCTRCGYPDCASYAQAIAENAAPFNQCPPGGAQGVARLAAILGVDPIPLSEAHGAEAPRAVAFIDEAWCIGCTLCLKACPTDAIVGASKKMHTVMEAYCTGCELCIPVCPVDCIQLENASGTATGWWAWSESLARQARQRYDAHRQRMPLEIPTEAEAENENENDSRSIPGNGNVPAVKAAFPPSASAAGTPDNTPARSAAERQAAIAAALQRARERRQTQGT